MSYMALYRKFRPDEFEDEFDDDFFSDEDEVQ